MRPKKSLEEKLILIFKERGLDIKQIDIENHGTRYVIRVG
jgi:hypothetical protein